MKPFLKLNDNHLALHFGDHHVYHHADGELVCDGTSARRSVFIVHSGMVRVSLISVKGAERLLFYGRAGCLMGDTMCFTPQEDVPAGLQVVAMGDCDIIRVSHEEFRRACTSSPTLAMEVISRAYSKVSKLIEQLEYATFHDTTCQLAALLQALSAELGRDGVEGSRGRLLHMTHQMMAAATGRTRVSVTYALNRLQDAGAIRLHRGHIEVTDATILDGFAEEAHDNVFVTSARPRDTQGGSAARKARAEAPRDDLAV